MAYDIKVHEICEVLFAPEDTVEIFRGTFPTGLNDTVDLVFGVENVLLEA